MVAQDHYLKENLNLKSEVLELKAENEKLKQMITINNGTINNNKDCTINNKYVTKINVFGKESIEHITHAILEKEILKIV